MARGKGSKKDGDGNGAAAAGEVVGAVGKASDDATIRMLNLVALLSNTSVPLSIDEIAIAMSTLDPRFRYGDEEGRRTKFNRDKKELLRMGVPIKVSTRSGRQAGVGEYIIDKDRYELINFGLTGEELDALQQAAAVVQLETTWGRSAVQWLGGAVDAPDMSEAARVAAGGIPALASLWEAVSQRCVATFGYHSRVRTFHPYGLLQRNGFWYVVGVEQAAAGVPQQTRTFRADRIEGTVVLSAPQQFEIPDGFDIRTSIPVDPKTFGAGTDVTATVLVDKFLANNVISELGPEAVLTARDDGSVEVGVPCGNYEAFRSWLFAMVDRAEVLAPADVRARIINDLRVLAGVAQ
ncbi:MAG: helix-turn-helix transcriptional regulator [Actinomycetota bacterium]